MLLLKGSYLGFSVTELMERDLSTDYFYEDGQLNTDELNSFLIRMSEIMIFLESKSLVYNDFKLANILVRGGIYKLGDLGSLAFYGNTDYVRTPYTFPPKIDFSGNRGVSLYSNHIFSLGCVIISIIFNNIHWAKIPPINNISALIDRERSFDVVKLFILELIRANDSLNQLYTTMTFYNKLSKFCVKLYACT